MNKQQLQQEIEQLKKRLEEKQKALAAMPEKWEPKGGDYIIESNGAVYHAPTVDDTRFFGTEYDTREQAEKAAKAMRAHNRLLAYVAEFAPDYQMSIGDVGWVVCYDSDNGKWRYTWCIDVYAGAVCMPEHVAEELTAKLNSGEVEL